MSVDTETENEAPIRDGSLPGSITPKQMRHLHVLLKKSGLADRDEALRWISVKLGGPVPTRKDLSIDDASVLIDALLDGEGPSDSDMPTVQEAIRRVMEDVGHVGVGKTGYNSDQKYNFRGISAFVNTLSPITSKHGVLIVPSVRDHVATERATKSGGVMMFVTMTVDWKVIGPRGDSISATTIGVGMDTSDKAANKAMSAAFKYLLGQVFMVPEIGWSEAEEDSPQLAPAGLPVPPDNAPLLARIAAYAKEDKRTVEDFTSRFRARHNNVSVPDMAFLNRDVLYAYLKQIEDYRAQEASPQRDPNKGLTQP